MSEGALQSKEYGYASRTPQVLRGLPAVAWILLPEMGLHVLIVLHGIGIEGSLQQVQLSPVQGFLHDITGSSASNQTLIRAYYISQSISSYACKPSSPLSSHATPLMAGLPESPVRQPQDTAMQRAMGCCNEDRFSRVAFKAEGDPKQSARQLNAEAREAQSPCHGSSQSCSCWLGLHSSHAHPLAAPAQTIWLGISASHVRIHSPRARFACPVLWHNDGR